MKSVSIPTLDSAIACFNAGVSIIPIDHSTKRPLMRMLPRGDDDKPTWAPFQKEIADEDTIVRWFEAGCEAFAVVGGSVSGGLLILDFDEPRFYDAWRKSVGDLANGLPTQRTGGGGFQVLLRCPETGTNDKLAWLPDPAAEQGRRIAIETRGEGGYAVVPPSLHPSGERYQWIVSPFDQESSELVIIPTLPQAHADALLAAARKLDEMPLTKQVMQKLELEARQDRQRRHAQRNGEASVIDAFNKAHDIVSMLENHGYRKGPGGRFIRPQGESESVTVWEDGTSCHWSTNDPLNNGKGKHGCGLNDAFDIYAYFDHAGDTTKAVRDAAQMLGISAPARPTSQRSSPPPADEDGANGSTPPESIELAPFGAPIPLTEKPAPKMPGGIFTGWLGDMIQATSEFAETPIELAAGFGLAAIATLVQGRLSVRPESGYFEPLCIWMLTAMESGNRKTATQREMCRPLATWEMAQGAAIAEKIKEAESERKTMEGRIARLRTEATKKSGTDFESAKKEIAEQEQALPEIPRAPRLFTGDITTEHLGTMMADHEERMAIISDEGGIFETMAGRYTNGVSNLDLYLQGHSASFVRVDRGSRPPVILHNPTLTMGLSPQPSILQGILGKDGFRGRGLLARFLYACPASPIGYRELRTKPIPDSVQRAYEAEMHMLAKLTPRQDGERNVPHVLTLDGDAWRAWKSFQREVETMMREGGQLEYLRDWGGKLPGTAARLAGLLHAANFTSCITESREIEAATMERAIVLARFYLDSALIVFDVMGAHPGAVAARLLWKNIEQARKQTFKARDAWMGLRSRYPTVDAIEPGFQTLADHNYIIETPNPDHGKRGRPSRTFKVNPELTEGWE